MWEGRCLSCGGRTTRAAQRRVRLRHEGAQSNSTRDRGKRGCAELPLAGASTEGHACRATTLGAAPQSCHPASCASRVSCLPAPVPSALPVARRCLPILPPAPAPHPVLLLFARQLAAEPDLLHLQQALVQHQAPNAWAGGGEVCEPWGSGQKAVKGLGGGETSRCEPRAGLCCSTPPCTTSLARSCCGPWCCRWTAPVQLLPAGGRRPALPAHPPLRLVMLPEAGSASSNFSARMMTSCQC